jgi:hypothetical protein
MEFLLCAEDLGDYDTGDIIDIHVDGFNWGTGERNSPRFQIVRLPNADLDNLEDCRTAYLTQSVRKCTLCNKFMAASAVDAHLEAVHSDVLFDVLVDPPRRKSAEELGVVGVKNRKWVIDSQGFGEGVAEICEKVFTNGDTEIAFATRKTTSVVVL